MLGDWVAQKTKTTRFYKRAKLTGAQYKHRVIFTLDGSHRVILTMDDHITNTLDYYNLL